jgi:hypothetical protein
MSDDRIVINGYEIQHKLVEELWKAPRAKPARDLLNFLGDEPASDLDQACAMRPPK